MIETYLMKLDDLRKNSHSTIKQLWLVAEERPYAPYFLLPVNLRTGRRILLHSLLFVLQTECRFRIEQASVSVEGNLSRQFQRKTKLGATVSIVNVDQVEGSANWFQCEADFVLIGRMPTSPSIFGCACSTFLSDLSVCFPERMLTWQ